MGLFFVFEMGHECLTFGFGLAELTAEVLGGHSSVDKHLMQSVSIRVPTTTVRW